MNNNKFRINNKYLMKINKINLYNFKGRAKKLDNFIKKKMNRKNKLMRRLVIFIV